MVDQKLSSTQWVETALVSLLSAPHISFPRLRGPTGISLGGPGPIDLFSTRFNHIFASDATGVVDGRYVDRERLKEKLLALQTHYNPDTAESQEKPATNGHHSGEGDAFITLTWTSNDAKKHTISSVANVIKQGDVEKISKLTLKGEQDLFVKPE